MNKPIIKGFTAELVKELFNIIIITYLLLLLAEQIFPGLVSSYINLNWVLLLTIVLGILDLFTERKEEKPKEPGLKDYIFISVLGISTLIIVKYKTSSFGLFSWFLSISISILITLIFLHILHETHKQ